LTVNSGCIILMDPGKDILVQGTLKLEGNDDNDGLILLQNAVSHAQLSLKYKFHLGTKEILGRDYRGSSKSVYFDSGVYYDWRGRT
jgi:hypothetical protein